MLRRGEEWVFRPQEQYEMVGDVADVVFPVRHRRLEGDELRIYYGAADTSIALATAKISDLLAWLRTEGGDAHGPADLSGRFAGAQDGSDPAD